MKVAFRVDGSSDIGMGHVIECLNIAKMLKKKGVHSLFIIKNHPVVLKKIRQYRYETKVLRDSVDEKGHLELTMGFLIKNEINLLIINLRDVDENFVKGLKDEGFTVVCIDELGGKKLFSDIIINGSAVEEWHDYETEAKCYFGASYMVMDENFAEFNKKNKKFGSKISKILVTMGGADRTGTTIKIIRALNGLDKKIKKIIVIGPAFKHRDELKKIIPKVKDNNFVFKYDVKSMAGLMYEADLAISAGGDTLYQLACTGTPSIALYEDEHEGTQSDTFAKKKIAINLGQGTQVSEELIVKSVSELLENLTLRKTMSINGKKLVDGLGAKRVSEIIIEKMKQAD